MSAGAIAADGGYRILDQRCAVILRDLFNQMIGNERHHMSPPESTSPTLGHDILVVGGSAGSIEPLQRMIAVLPADFPAAIFVVIHIGGHLSYLDKLLVRTAKLPVVLARNGQPIRHGCVALAVPDEHLLLHDEHLLLRRGPQENRTRPAIDPLFRTAACTFGGRVIGVILSGGLNDGTAGLKAVKECGGLAVVQDPDDAEVGDMPRSALSNVLVDHVVPASDLGQLLVNLVTLPAARTPPIPFGIRLEAAIAVQEKNRMVEMDRLGMRSRFTCPECQGTLWEIADGDLLRYRCHVGHAFTVDAMVVAQAAEMEGILWRLLRSAEESDELVSRLAEHAREQQNEPIARQWETRARRYKQDAALVREMLEERNIQEVAAGRVYGEERQQFKRSSGGF
jgi:two-component system, chemotaxis family, protein-glutamate methylesterase/glutaminase